ncbi:MAG TPA: hypothetical protein VK892_21645 [Pyrinomonadaceae bacterium]|nr:hypothetical protein [Pyrinomonadaceae bacterium]
MKVYKIAIFIILAAVFAACSRTAEPPPDSPTATLRKYVEASQKNDLEGMKQRLSQASLKLMQESAQKRNMTIEEILKQGSAVPIEGMPETRNEKIERDTATVEVANDTTGEFDVKIPFVRENGSWKIALDKYVEEILRKTTEDMSKPPANVSTETNKK